MTLVSYLILLVVAILATILGGVTGYFYFRARHREQISVVEGLAIDLEEREKIMCRVEPAGVVLPDAAEQRELRELRVDLEQKKNEIRILRQDFEVETRVLTDEIEQLKQKLSGSGQDERRLHRVAEDLEKQRATLEVEREKTVSAREEMDRIQKALDLERAELDRVRQHLRERESRLDDRLLSIPIENFSSRQEGFLIRRLREEIKRQREELETMYASRRRAS